MQRSFQAGGRINSRSTAGGCKGSTGSLSRTCWLLRLLPAITMVALVMMMRGSACCSSSHQVQHHPAAVYNYQHQSNRVLPCKVADFRLMSFKAPLSHTLGCVGAGAAMQCCVCTSCHCRFVVRPTIITDSSRYTPAHSTAHACTPSFDCSRVRARCMQTLATEYGTSRDQRVGTVATPTGLAPLKSD